MKALGFTDSKLTEEERKLIDDLIVHTLEQTCGLIQRTQALVPEHLKHHISMNLVSGLTSIAVLDWAFALLQKLPPEKMPSPKEMMWHMHQRIAETQLEVLPKLVRELMARAEAREHV